MSKGSRIAVTLLVLVGAVAVFGFKYRHYIMNPWTRDGQVRAQVIQITPRVSGPIVELPIADNQRVAAGDVLFRIDPRTFEAALEQAQAAFDETRDEISSLEKQVEAAQAIVDAARAELEQAKVTVEGRQSQERQATLEHERQKKLQKEGATSTRAVEKATSDYEVAVDQTRRARAALLQSEAAVAQSEAELAKAQATLGAAGDANARLRKAKAAVLSAQLDLEFAEVRAPVDGYVTNLTLRLGSQAVANQPALALVDIASYWVHGYFRETLVGRVRPGDRAVVTLMSYPDTPLAGVVDSIGWGIAQHDGSTGFDLLPNVSPTFQWIRLAQRVPVRVHLEDVPDDVELRVGTTASVLVLTGTAGSAGAAKKVPPTPKSLQ